MRKNPRLQSESLSAIRSRTGSASSSNRPGSGKSSVGRAGLYAALCSGAVEGRRRCQRANFPATNHLFFTNQKRLVEAWRSPDQDEKGWLLSAPIRRPCFLERHEPAT